MITITKCVQTCFACPSQWSMWSDRGSYLYARERHGIFRLEIETGLDRREELHSMLFDDIMTTEDMKRHCEHVLRFDVNCEYEVSSE